jgi:hypothetical protein
MQGSTNVTIRPGKSPLKTALNIRDRGFSGDACERRQEREQRHPGTSVSIERF